MLTSFLIKGSSSSILKRILLSSPKSPFIPLTLAFRTISTQKTQPALETFNQNEINNRNSFDLPITRRGTRSSSQKHSRTMWTPEEDEKLRELFLTYGPRYALISHKLTNRSPSTIYVRCKTLSLCGDGLDRGPWKKDELQALRILTANHEEGIDWNKVQRALPRPRELSSIRHTWYHTINPRWNHGRWSEKETERLEQLIRKVGINDWCSVSDLLGTRSPRQCLEKYRYQIAPTHKGRFSPQEDRDIMLAVEKFGDADFMKIKDFMKSNRTARQISQHYRYALDPAYDRSTWTEEEKREVYLNALKMDNDMVKVKETLGSKRHVKDMWNNCLAFKRQFEWSQRAEKVLDKNKIEQSD